MRGFAVALFVLCVAARSFAQPAAPDFEQARKLYDAASEAMDQGRHDDAARDFRAAFDITKDPVLYFKIGSAYEKAGKCSEAVDYYERYLTDAKPEDNFATLTRERIDVCKLKLATKPAEPATPDAAVEPKPEPAAPAAPVEPPSKNKDRAWLFVGGALAFVTAGVVLAYSAESSEQDLKDLYVSQNGNPPVFDPETQERYDELVAEGERFQYLSWTSFGIAGACAIGATIFFLRDRGDVSVTPVVTPKETGVSATIRF